MKWLAVTACCIATLAASSFAAAAGPATPPEPDAAEIVEKNAAARGGLEAWRKIQTMAWVGYIESEGAPAPRVPFVLRMKRPNKTRFEISMQNQIAARIYDGSQGWKVRPMRDGQPGLHPYTTEELNFARDGQGIDGPLLDYQAKGNSVALGGVDEVEGRKAYRLEVRLPSGTRHQVWVDAQSFLEIKSDRESRSALGRAGTVSVFYRDYRLVDGLRMPFLIESGSPGKGLNKMMIDKVVLNPPLEDGVFAKPRLPEQRKGASVDTIRMREQRDDRRASPLPGWPARGPAGAR